MKTKTVETTVKHERLHKVLIRTLQREAPDLPADEVLAVVCVLVGQLIAHQDQRRFSSAAIMALVYENIEAGNRHVVADFLKAEGGHA